MKRRTYPIELKKSIVQKILSQGPEIIKQISKEYNICEPILYRWTREFAKIGNMENIQSRPQDRDSETKFNIVFNYLNTPEERRGEFIRREGVHTDHIEQWTEDMKNGLKNPNRNKQSSAEIQVNQRKVKALEKEMIQKDKVLAEVTALLVLKKKVHQIWEILD